jgi:hypothetical protein
MRRTQLTTMSMSAWRTQSRLLSGGALRNMWSRGGERLNLEERSSNFFFFSKTAARSSFSSSSSSSSSSTVRQRDRYWTFVKEALLNHETPVMNQKKSGIGMSFSELVRGTRSLTKNELTCLTLLYTVLFCFACVRFIRLATRALSSHWPRFATRTCST